jgi:Fe-S-cluster-containing dehydrogenase component
MNMDRRQFLRGVVATGVLAGAAAPKTAEAIVRAPKQMSPLALGMLYDSTLCIGCKACVDACKRANGMPDEIPDHLSGWNENTWDTAEDLSGRTLNVIKAYRHGTMAKKDSAENGYAFVKRHCLHCVDASCVSACPVSAMTKDPETGIVFHDPDACIGCRYCVFVCPFGVPQYDLDNPFGKIQKCQMCAHLQAKGEMPACCDVCPTGASLFGVVSELRVEADRRLALNPGSTYDYPRGRLGGDRPTHEAAAPRYIPAVYGDTEVSGTQVRYLSAVPFEKLGLPKLPAQAFAAITEGLQNLLYGKFIGPLVLFVGFAALAFRSHKQHAEDDE